MLQARFDLACSWMVLESASYRPRPLYKNQSTEGTEFVWVSEYQKGEGCEIIKQFVFHLYSATNAFQRFKCSRLAIRLIATLIFDAMFI
jgi:hypothetical protein